MPDFTGDDPSKTATTEQTNFHDGSAGESQNDDTTPKDTDEIVLEHEGRKFTKADLLKKLTHSDDFIEQLKKEREQDRGLLNEVNEKLSKQVDVAEVLKEMREGQQTQTLQQPEEQKVEEPFDPSKITSEVMSQLSAQKQKEAQEGNWKDVTSKLSQKFGNKTNEVVFGRAKENGLSTDEAAELARNKPKVFLAMFPELSSQGRQHNPVHSSSLNSSAFDQQQQNKPKPSGYAEAKTTKDRTEAYLKRLQELS